jgi:molecular chaperone HtpG
MVDGQDKIYYLAAESFDLARRSPQLEVFRKRGVEVLLLHDRVDEWLMSALAEFDGKALTDITRGELALPGTDEDKDDTADQTSDGLINRLKSVLGDQVQEVRKSQRLTDSPACLVLGEDDMGTQMRRIMEAAGQAVPESAPHFEVNGTHPLIKRLDAETDDGRFEQLTRLLFDQATLADGRQLKDPGAYVERSNQLLVELLGQEDNA